MPQNFRTRSVGLNQAWVEELRTLPTFKVDREKAWCDEYRVVDVVLQDGRRLEGVLAIDDDLLVHEDEAEFAPEDIVSMSATPKYRLPDFTITDEDSVWNLNKNGDRLTIEWGNSKRLSMFGPEEVEPDWRTMPIEDCWEEALRDNRYAYSYEELPCGSGPNKIRLVPGGVEISFRSASRDAHEKLVVKPRTSKLWAEVLRMVPEIDDAFTLRDLLDLLDLPAEMSREIYCRTMRWEADTFADWVEIAKTFPADPDTSLEYLEVYNGADEHAGEYWFSVDAHGVSKPLTEESEEIRNPDYGGGYKIGDRVQYALDFTPLPKLLHLPIRVKDELKIPVTHEEIMAYYRGPLHDFRIGKLKEEPEYPWAFKARKPITFGEIIGAIFSEISLIVSEDHRDEHPLWQELMSSLEEVREDVEARKATKDGSGA